MKLHLKTLSFHIITNHWSKSFALGNCFPGFWLHLSPVFRPKLCGRRGRWRSWRTSKKSQCQWHDTPVYQVSFGSIKPKKPAQYKRNWVRLHQHRHSHNASGHGHVSDLVAIYHAIPSTLHTVYTLEWNSSKAMFFHKPGMTRLCGIPNGWTMRKGRGKWTSNQFWGRHHVWWGMDGMGRGKHTT